MSANLVDRDASRECDSSLELLGFLVAENLEEFLINECIDSSTDSLDIGAFNTLGNSKFQCGYNQKYGLFIVQKIWMLI